MAVARCIDAGKKGGWVLKGEMTRTSPVMRSGVKDACTLDQ